VQGLTGLLLLAPALLALGCLAAIGELGAGLGLVSAYGLLALAYVVAWSTLGLALSCWSRQAATALLAGVTVWVLVGVLAPRALAALAEDRFPTPVPAATEQALQGALNEAREIYRKQIEKARAQGATLDARTMATLRQTYFQAYYARADQILQPLEAAETARRRWFHRWAWVSPSLTFHLAAAGLAGTDGARHAAFREAADAYARTLREWLDERAMAGQTGRPQWEEWPRLPWAHKDRVTAFLPLSGVVLSLLLWTLGALAVGYGGLIRVSWRGPAAGQSF
jgi:hypothetical protein